MSDTIEALTETVRGRVITASDPDYDDARAVYNAMHDLFHVNQNIAPAKRR